MGWPPHAGDSLYECCYIPEFPKAARALRDYDGSIVKWWDHFRGSTAFTKQSDELLLMLLGTSACFSAEPDGTPILPFDPHSGRSRDDIWARWLAWDPVRMVARYSDALRSLRAIWIGAGTRDEWYIDLGHARWRLGTSAADRGRRRNECFCIGVGPGECGQVPLLFEFAFRGTDTGDMRLPGGATVPLTGKVVEFTGAQLFRVSGGKSLRRDAP